MKKLMRISVCAIVVMTWTLMVAAQTATRNSGQSAVVRSMGNDLIRPLPTVQLHKLPAVRPMRDNSRRSIRRVAADYKMPAQIYGLMVYSKKWPNGSGAGNFGVYTFTAENPNVMTSLIKDDAFAASGGATYANGHLKVLNYSSLWGTIILDYDYYDYSTQYWDLLQHVHQEDVTRLMSACSAYDPTTGKYYAVMYTEDMSHQVFGTLDYDQNSRQVIYQLPDAQNVAAMAINSDGVIYAIRFDGKLVTVNKATGQHTVIGSTGITPQYLQSAAIDPRTGRLFWAACSAQDPIGLYEVSLETGEAVLIEEFKNSEEFVGLYIPMPTVEEDAPAIPTGIVASFTADNLEGTVNFRLPRQTYAGEAITDATLGYRVYVDGQLTVEGSGQPYEMVRPEVSVATDKMYRFEVCAYNEVGEGPRLHLDKFVGKDRPTAPTSVRLVRVTGTDDVKLTWNAPSATGVNKGYVNRDNLNYTVVRQPGDVVVAEKTTERTFTETLPTEQLTNYYYVVTAFNGDIEGLSAESNRLTMGSVVEPPYFENFEDLSVIPNMYTFIDANHDGCTWRAGFWNGTQNSDLYYEYNDDQKTPGDDWAMTPPVHLKANRFYALTFDVNASFWGTEKMSAWMGEDKTVAAMKTHLTDVNNIDYTDPRTFSCQIKSDADGKYYFGFHCVSDADQGMLELDNIRIEEKGVFEAPDTVTNFIVTPGANGRVTATLTFCAPTTDFYGEPLTSLDKIEIYRDGELKHTIEQPEPGSELTFEDKALPNRNVTWSIYTYNSYGCGIPAERTAWIGTDIPTEPTDVKLVMSGTTARLTWKAPTTGIHGGYIRPSQLTYNIEDMNSYIKGDHRSGTAFSENRGAKQEFLYYRVSAQSSAGGGNYAYSNTVISGTPYKLPFKESFANASTSQLWSQQNSGGAIGLTQSIAADGDQGAALFKPAMNGDVGMITSGKINVSTAQHPILEFYYYAVPHQTTSLTVGVVPEGDAEQLEALKVIDYSKLTGSEGWRKVTLSLENYVNTSHILLSFIGRATGIRHGDVAFDAINVREQDDIDLAVASLQVNALVEAGTLAKGVASVYNNGRLQASDYKVRLTKNGELVSEVSGPVLASAASADITFDVPTSVADEGLQTLEVSVVTDGDAVDQNNSATATFALEQPPYPVPVELTGIDEDGELSLRWMAPDLAPRNIMSLDDIEQYRPFIIDDMGRWTLRDADGQLTGSIVLGSDQTVMYDNVGQPMAYQVFRPDAVGLGQIAALQPHSGQQMLINMTEVNNATADDWLISPELPGTEQTISFWVKSMGNDYIESFAVLASSSDDRAASFQTVEASATTAPAEWTQVTAQLPAGTKYFAIRVHARQKFMLMIDDIEYARINTANLRLLGYNVYLGGERVNEEIITSPSYQLTWFGAGDCRVSAVYEQGESALSQPVSLLDAIRNVTAEERTAEGPVYDLQGRRVVHTQLPSGVYLKKNRKVIVK